MENKVTFWSLWVKNNLLNLHNIELRRIILIIYEKKESIWCFYSPRTPKFGDFLGGIGKCGNLLKELCKRKSIKCTKMLS